VEATRKGKEKKLGFNKKTFSKNTLSVVVSSKPIGAKQ
jgi:hypothetical protein